MAYNTQLPRLVMPEYGRHVQQLVEKLLCISDREVRTREAYNIVKVMLGQNPQLRNVEEQERRVWEHLYIISRYELDVDAPYPLTRPTPASVQMRRRHLPYPVRHGKINHYGVLVPRMLDAICKIPSLERQLRFGLQTANQMKRCYLNWNKSAVEDAEIIADVERLSGGQIALANAVLEGSDFPPQHPLPRRGPQQSMPGRQNTHLVQRNGQFSQNGRMQPTVGGRPVAQQNPRPAQRTLSQQRVQPTENVPAQGRPRANVGQNGGQNGGQPRPRFAQPQLHIQPHSQPQVQPHPQSHPQPHIQPQVQPQPHSQPQVQPHPQSPVPLHPQPQPHPQPHIPPQTQPIPHPIPVPRVPVRSPERMTTRPVPQEGQDAGNSPRPWQRRRPRRRRNDA